MCPLGEAIITGIISAYNQISNQGATKRFCHDGHVAICISIYGSKISTHIIKCMINWPQFFNSNLRMIEYIITLQKRYVSWYVFCISMRVLMTVAVGTWLYNDVINYYVKMTSFWRNNDVIVMSCVRWGITIHGGSLQVWPSSLMMHASLAWGWLNLLIISNANSNCFRRWAPVQILLISLLSVHFYGIFTPQPRWPDGWCRWLRPSVRPSAGQLMARAWPQWPWAPLTSARCH